MPLAYAYDEVISRESYDELTAAQKQEALLQACVLEGIGQDAMALSYSSEMLSTAVLSVSGGSFNEEGAFVADERDASVTVECKGVTEGELYVDLLDLQYEGVRRYHGESGCWRVMPTLSQRLIRSTLKRPMGRQRSLMH